MVSRSSAAHQPSSRRFITQPPQSSWVENRRGTSSPSISITSSWQQQAAQFSQVMSAAISGVAISVQIDCVLLEQVERHDFQRCLVGRVQRDFRRLAGTPGLDPAGGAQAPALTGLKTGEIKFRAWCRQVVAGRFRIGKEFFGQHDTDRVAAEIIFRGIAATVAKKAGDRAIAAGQQWPTQDIELAATAGKIAAFHGVSGDFVDPRLLDGFEYFLAAVLGIVVETGQGHDPIAQINEIDLQRILVGMGIAQFDGDVVDVGPFHLRWPSFAMLMLYFGISTVSGVLLTIAWQPRRELGSRPHALSSRSSSISSAGSSELKPSRTTTWQVVQAQDISQAWSSSISLASRFSQIDLPSSASITAPSGHSSTCGSTIIRVMPFLPLHQP